VPLPPSTEIAHELAEGGKGFLRFIPRVINILDSLQRLSKAVDEQGRQIEEIRQRLDRIEAREEMLLAKIESAALKATADLSGRLGRIEGLLEARDRRD